jgi:uncharacterized membrane protein YbhN (UPF0104 family)
MSGSVWRNPRVWIGIGISAAAIGIAVYRVELGEAAEAFQAANYWWLLPGLVFALLSFFLRAVRWQALFHPLSLPLERVFWIMAIGYTVTTLLPLRLGIHHRPYAITAWSHARRDRRRRPRVLRPTGEQHSCEG